MKNPNSLQVKGMTIKNINLIENIQLQFKKIIEIEHSISDKGLAKSIKNSDLAINDLISKAILNIDENTRFLDDLYSENSPLIRIDNIYMTTYKRFEKASLNLNYILELLERAKSNITYISNLEDYSSEDIDKINNYSPLKRNILANLNSTFDDFLSIKDNLKELELDEIEYIKRFKNETSLIEQKFENRVNELILDLENKFKSYDLKYDQVFKSSNLLSTGVDGGLKSLNLLNERTQKIEFEFSKIIGAESEKVKNDLNGSRTALNNVIQEITTSANTKLNEINKAHTDFINLVSNAGIYKLTENYSNKAKEEKTQYETYRTYTSRAIGAAIVFTVIILTIPLIEYWGAVPAVDTNYYTILARLTISLMFFVLALYFSKQASKHYECYQDNHRTFLQLAALEPFMANMTPEEKQEIRKSLVPSYFNQGADGKFATKGDDVDMSMMFTFMDKLSNFAQNKKDTKAAESTATNTKPVI